MGTRRDKGFRSAVELSEASGLSRSFVYYLVERGLLPAAGPRGARMVFSPEAVNLAKVFGSLARRGVRLRGLVALVLDVLDGHYRSLAAERLEPLRSRIKALERMMNEEIDAAFDMQARGPQIDSIASAEDVVSRRRDFTRELERSVGRTLLDLAGQRDALKQEYETTVRGLVSTIPLDDPMWAVLDPLFGGRKRRTEFLELMSRTGVLERLASERVKTIQAEG